MPAPPAGLGIVRGGPVRVGGGVIRRGRRGRVFPSPHGTLQGDVAVATEDIARGDERAVLLEVAQRRAHARAGLDVHARVDEAHLGARERAEQHDLVHVAQVPDAEDLPLDLVQAGAERQVVLGPHGAHHVGGVDALGAPHDRERVGVPPRVGAEQLEAPGGDRAARALGVLGVARHDVVHALRQHAVELLAQAVQQRDGGGVREVALGVHLVHVRPAEEDLGQR
mmetsp:Transcript_14711/g.61323  ORF Transcript_14711/g.61323 Transcript_14711/m.61323 type:complete len:225 (-) Transcript_14711:794-1468(-)